MKPLKAYDIKFIGLKNGTHTFYFELNNTFFELFGFQEFNNSSLRAKVILEKKINLLEFQFSIKGTVNVNCDLSNEAFEQKISGKQYLVVKFGDDFNDEDDEILIIPHGEYQVNIAQYLYETTVLSVPKKLVHPGVKDGTLKSDILIKLEDLKPKSEPVLNKETDPRWDTLKKLLTDK